MIDENNYSLFSASFRLFWGSSGRSSERKAMLVWTLPSRDGRKHSSCDSIHFVSLLRTSGIQTKLMSPGLSSVVTEKQLKRGWKKSIRIEVDYFTTDSKLHPRYPCSTSAMVASYIRGCMKLYPRMYEALSANVWSFNRECKLIHPRM